MIRRLIQWLWYKKIEKNKKLIDVIAFESVPVLSDNTKGIFDEMLKRGLNKKYKLVWLIWDKEKVNNFKSEHKNVEFVYVKSRKGNRYDWYAKAKISCNEVLIKKDKKQFCIYLTHGTALKSVRNYYNIPKEMDYCLLASKDVFDLQSYELCFAKEKAIALGFPRNDELTNSKIDVRSILGTDCKKIVVWYPTYRQRKDGFEVKGNSLPVIHDEEQAKNLNEAAKKLNVLLVLKPQFAQNLSYVKDLHLSNIRFIDDSFFVKNNVSSYQFVGSCDALITDYSSIYYDFTLCDKPIAAIWEDIEKYKESPGLVENYEFWAKGMEKVYTLEDFISFLERVAQGKDVLQKERREIRDLANISIDGKNSQRVVDFIMQKANL